MALSKDPAARRQNAQAQRAAIQRDHDWKTEATRLASFTTKREAAHNCQTDYSSSGPLIHSSSSSGSIRLIFL